MPPRPIARTIWYRPSVVPGGSMSTRSADASLATVPSRITSSSAGGHANLDPAGYVSVNVRVRGDRRSKFPTTSLIDSGHAGRERRLAGGLRTGKPRVAGGDARLRTVRGPCPTGRVLVGRRQRGSRFRERGGSVSGLRRRPWGSGGDRSSRGTVHRHRALFAQAPRPAAGVHRRRDAGSAVEVVVAARAAHLALRWAGPPAGVDPRGRQPDSDRLPAGHPRGGWARGARPRFAGAGRLRPRSAALAGGLPGGVPGSARGGGRRADAQGSQPPSTTSDRAHDAGRDGRSLWRAPCDGGAPSHGAARRDRGRRARAVSYTHLRAHETGRNLVC